MTERRAYDRIDPRKARAWSATLKPNSILRHEAPSRVGTLRALMLLMKHGRKILTYGEIAALSGFSWRTVQDAIKWARAARLIWAAKAGRGQGMTYVLMPALGENFLGVRAVSKRRQDTHLNSHHKRGAKAPLSSAEAERKSAPRCDAAPTPPSPRPGHGAGGAAGSGANSQSGRGRVPSAGPAGKPAPSAAGSPPAAGALQRSKPEQSAADRAAFDAAMAEWRAFKATAPPPPRAGSRAPAGRRRVVQHPDQIPKPKRE